VRTDDRRVLIDDVAELPLDAPCLGEPALYCRPRGTDSSDDQSQETDTPVVSVSAQNRDNTQRPTLAPVLAASEAATGAAVGVTWHARSICAFSSTMQTCWNSPAGYKSTRFGES
jgi:hypothetical protein